MELGRESREAVPTVSQPISSCANMSSHRLSP